ncbi:MAG: sigma-54-dependent Fis family transcriptional regulator [Alphaproteobacteria bacterium]|nr:sigma-54-dependent Fis family transcriptional regulator [Alphaproteobacteria bacterium]
MTANILIVDDEADIRTLIQGILEDDGYTTRIAENSTQAYKAIEDKNPGLIVLDIWLQGSKDDGLKILKNVKDKHPHIPVIMISGHGTIETAVSSIKQGAYDFIEKPFKSDRLLLMIKRALEAAALKRENESLRQRSASTVLELIGSSSATQELGEMIERVAVTNSRVLLTGEPGSGKDVAARLLHAKSERASQPFMALSCATLHPERLELELFGSKDEQGALEKAHGGTLLLDEVADMPLETQGKILRVIQEQRFQKTGSAQSVETDVRIIASSNKDLETLIENGDFREDLYYRLNVVPIKLTPLRERKEDIPALMDYFVEVLNKDSGLMKKTFSPAAIKAMQSYGWPGNVRQLRNVVEWALIMDRHQEGEMIELEGLPPEVTGRDSKSVGGGEMTSNAAIREDILAMPLREAREVFEREYLESQVERFEGNISKTAEFVGMERSALHRKLKSLKEAVPDEAAEDTKLKRA